MNKERVPPFVAIIELNCPRINVHAAIGGCHFHIPDILSTFYVRLNQQATKFFKENESHFLNISMQVKRHSINQPKLTIKFSSLGN